MKFKYLLNESAEFDLYPAIKDVAKLGKMFQKDGEIQWVNNNGDKFCTYHNGSLHKYLKDEYDLYKVIDSKNIEDDEYSNYNERIVTNPSRYTLHFPAGLKEPKY